MPTVLALPLANISSFVDTMIDAFLYNYWILDKTANVAYRSMEPKQFGPQNGLAVRYLFGKQVDINPNGTFTSSDVQPINVQQQTITALQDIKSGTQCKRTDKALYKNVGKQPGYKKHFIQCVPIIIAGV
ncbi:MAG: hypothetical protein EZS28_004075 [Streblomastix strix]|uniref:Uncharacterized protein n=1 Tax=Streblomastix strix TaxID=222440 RepID=A0A5J4WZP3_9EUKA|nr:MAG: hypothetical protein EZS28_004075 [Streblomastix strix]